MGAIYSIIDVGTNSILLLIAEMIKDNISVLHRDAQTSSLGKGMKNGILHQDGIDRAKAILTNYIKTSNQYHAEKIIITGTSASREAENISELSNWLKNEYDLPYHILSEKQEGYYIYLANKYDFSDNNNLIIFDIGGGSTEFMIMKHGRLDYSISTKIGVRRLNNDFKIEKEKSEYCKNILKDSHVSQYTSENYRVVGVGGTVTNLVAVKLKLKKWEPDKIHKQKLTLKDVEYFKSVWQRLSYDDIEKLIPFDTHRSDVLLSGTIILENIFEYLKIDQIFVSDKGLQFGILQKVDKF